MLVLQLRLYCPNLKLMFGLLVASQTLDGLAGLLNDPNPFTVKVVIQCLTTAYPLLFRSL